MNERKGTLFEHLDDLRRVLTVSAIVIMVASAVSFFFLGDWLFKFLTDPLQKFDVKLVYIGITEAFFAKIKLSVLAGFIISLPVILWQIWNFVAPALFPKERRYLLLVIPLSLLLFAIGAIFAYLVVFNFAARYLLVVIRGDLQPMLSVGQYISFLIAFLIPFGAVFETPLVMYYLARFGIIKHSMLAKNRKYVILGIFVAAAALTPGPDVISQVLLAVPLVLLFEIGVLVTRFVKPRREAEKESSS
ncbi:MAG: twin-arginine translocase subunit TatC [Bacillota bacterium]